MSVEKARYHVYVVTHVTTKRHYVGKLTGKPERRWNAHVRDALNGNHRCRLFHRALARYGKDAFTWQVIESFTSEQDAFDAEAFWIEFLQSTVRGMGFNIFRDGVGGWGHAVSDETREKLRKANLGKKYGPETKAKQSAQRLGKKRPPRSADWCQKISDARKREIANGTRDWSALHRPETKAKLKGTPKTYTPEGLAAMKARVSAQMKAQWADPEYRDRHSESMRSLNGSPSRSLGVSRRNAAMWKNPEYRAKMIEIITQRARERSARKQS